LIRTLTVDYAPILVCSRDDCKTVAETAFDEMMMAVVQAYSEFSLLISEQNHSDLSLNTLDDALNPFYQQKGIFREQIMSKSAEPKVDDLLATDSHQLQEYMIHMIRSAIETLVYEAEKVSTTKRR
jgi:hypothetical protein